jgi:hypothetical protein
MIAHADQWTPSFFELQRVLENLPPIELGKSGSPVRERWRVPIVELNSVFQLGQAEVERFQSIKTITVEPRQIFWKEGATQREAWIWTYTGTVYVTPERAAEFKEESSVLRGLMDTVAKLAKYIRNSNDDAWLGLSPQQNDLMARCSRLLVEREYREKYGRQL